MILIDAIFINNGGGKVLMDYLYDNLKRKAIGKLVILFDERIRPDYCSENILNIEKVFLKGLSDRNNFYRKNRNDFSAVLCFGNIPPPLRLKAKVFTYFHQPIYLGIPTTFSYTERFKFFLKIQILRKYSKNSDFWLVQSDFIRNALAKKFKIEKEIILEVPFYPSFSMDGTFEKVKNSFIYVSAASPHKNHTLLIDAFCKFYDQQSEGSLILTVDEIHTQIYQLIQKKIKEGYPITNLGFIPRSDLYLHYQKAEYLIYPSLAESFGLGIIEAVENGCKVIGADLPYLHEVCTPSLLFNPLDRDSIIMSLCRATSGDPMPPTILRTSNQVNKLIQLITSTDADQK